MSDTGAFRRGEALSTSAVRQSQSALAWTQAAHPTSPRRTTIAFDGLSPRPTSSTGVYDKQLLWKQRGQKKVEHKTLELLSQEDVECTFAPKINRSCLSRKIPFTMAADAVSTPRDCLSDDASWDGSSNYSQSPRTVRSTDPLDSRRDLDQPADSVEFEGAAAIPMEVSPHPTEAQTSSILLHLARQERAREEAHKAQCKLSSTQPRKDYSKVTAARPFELSVTNRKPRRSSSASPTERPTRSRSRSGTSRSGGAVARVAAVGGATTPSGHLVKRRSNTSVGREEDTRGEVGNAGSNPDELPHTAATRQPDALLHQWTEERRSLLSIIETQRQALEQREQAQHDAARLAQTFAAAVEAFEERLEIVERTASTELSEMKSLLAKQSAATDLILHALGLENPPPSASSSSSSQPPHASPPLNASLRREPKRS